MGILTREQILTSKDTDFICKRDELMSTPDVTLDGHRAYIGGRLNNYATVWCPDSLLMHQATFAWSAVEHVIMNDNGEFHS